MGGGGVDLLEIYSNKIFIGKRLDKNILMAYNGVSYKQE
jgi:hypothetical protein